ncbi:MAG: DUF1566 domain-containing protein [Betaproteobacteria bacterium]|nr:DUF1566 domain-containing protein [Betaproteobacteria bacterium]
MKQFALGALAAALGAGSYVIAAVVFSDFQSGTTISASEMNAKLNALKDAVNAATASVVCPPSSPARFTDNGDGTVCDSLTGLMWEKKETCGGLNFSNPHCIENAYQWTDDTLTPPFTAPDGTLYTSFLRKLNDLESSHSGLTSACFAGHCDWRIPSIGELRSIVGASVPNCTGTCIAAGFPGSLAETTSTWSSSSRESLLEAYSLEFPTGLLTWDLKGTSLHARAVRGGPMR